MGWGNLAQTLRNAANSASNVTQSAANQGVDVATQVANRGSNTHRPEPEPKSPIVRRVTPRGGSYNGGGGSGGGGRGGGGGNNGGSPAPPAPPPVRQVKSIEDWLAGDTTYNQQQNEFNASQQAYEQNRQNSMNQVNQNYDATNRQMNRQADVDRQNQQYDFAGRGVLTSGVYAKSLGDYNTNFQNQLANLLQGKNQQLSTIDTDFNNFLRQLQLQKDSAKQDAVRRRAMEYGL